MSATPQRKWVLSEETLPVGKDRAIGVRLRGKKIMWIGGQADDPADNNRTFIYDVRRRRFRESAPVPAAKQMNPTVAVGVLRDGSVVVAGGEIAGPAGETSHLSYRYDPDRDTWHRTGDLPEPQRFVFTPTNRLADGRLLIAGGVGLDGIATGAGSLNAFVFDPKLYTRVQSIDADTGVPTGETQQVLGKWDYTRKVSDNSVSRLGCGHVFGHSVPLRDGRVFVVGGHTFWKPGPQPNDLSELATDTDYFDPATGIWTTGAPLPSVDGEDSRIANSYGGRANGVGVAVLDNGKVVIAGGNSQIDGDSYFKTAIGRRSILVMTVAANPLNSTYQLSPIRIPSGRDAGGLFGDGGRNQLLCYSISGNRAVIAGGQSHLGEDLFDTYTFDAETWELTRGPDLAHSLSIYTLKRPELGYPADYESPVISSRAVGMTNSNLVFADGTLVRGGAYDAVDGGDDLVGSRYVEQLILGKGHQHHTPPGHPTGADITAVGERQPQRGRY